MQRPGHAWNRQATRTPVTALSYLAAAATVGTLPGRTQGLGLVTEPLIKSLHIDRGLYAELNLWATLIGALFAVGIGRLIDKAGSRTVLTALLLGLGIVTLLMSGVTGIIALAACLTLTRGLGQGALSVASQALIGKWFSRRLGSAMAAFSVILSSGRAVQFGIRADRLRHRSVQREHSGRAWYRRRRMRS